MGDVMVRYDQITFQEIDPPEHIRRVCSDCLICSDCFQYALDNYEHGWWGGTSFRNRDRIRRRNRATQNAVETENKD